MDKLSTEVRRNLTRQLGKSETDLKELCSGLKVKIDMMEDLPQITKPPSKQETVMQVGVKNTQVAPNARINETNQSKDDVPYVTQRITNKLLYSGPSERSLEDRRQ